MRSARTTLLVLSLLSPSISVGQAAPPPSGAVDLEAMLQAAKQAGPCAAASTMQQGPRESPDSAGKKDKVVTAKADSSCGSAMGAMGVGAGAVAGNQQLMAAMAEMTARMSPAQAAQMQKLMTEMQARMPHVQAQITPGDGANMPADNMSNDSVPTMPSMSPGAGSVPAMSMSGRSLEHKGLELSSHLKDDLEQGRTIIRSIEWTPGAGTVSPGGADSFNRGMVKLAAAMKQAGGSYRLDLYMDQQSGNAVVRTLGPQRLATVQAALVAQGAASAQVGDSRKDGNPRLEIVRSR